MSVERLNCTYRPWHTELCRSGVASKCGAIARVRLMWQRAGGAALAQGPDLECRLRRTRLQRSLAFSLLLACMCIGLVLPQVAATYAAHGVATAPQVMLWGSLWHLTCSILAPTLVTYYMESCERRHFFNELPLPAACKAKAL